MSAVSVFDFPLPQSCTKILPIDEYYFCWWWSCFMARRKCGEERRVGGAWAEGGWLDSRYTIQRAMHMKFKDKARSAPVLLFLLIISSLSPHPHLSQWLTFANLSENKKMVQSTTSWSHRVVQSFREPFHLVLVGLNLWLPKVEIDFFLSEFVMGSTQI